MRDSRPYLAHIRECVDRILSYTDGLGRDWSKHQMSLGAVCRNLEIIGYTANKLGEPYRSAHPEIPWRRIIGARNILIHAYHLVQPDILEEVVERDLPLLRRQIVALLSAEDRQRLAWRLTLSRDPPHGDDGDIVVLAPRLRGFGDLLGGLARELAREVEAEEFPPQVLGLDVHFSDRVRRHVFRVCRGRQREQ